MPSTFAFQKLTELACSGKEIYHFFFFYFVFEGKFQVQAPQGAYIRRGDLTEGFLRYDFGGLIFGGAYFRNFTVHFHMNSIFVGIRIFPASKFIIGPFWSHQSDAW